MKKISFKSSYNLDVLSFLNIMSADDYYVNFYKDEFEKFYPLLSDGIKSTYKSFLESIGRSNIAVALTTAVSLIENFNDRDVKELLVAQDEIEKNLYDAQYPDILINGIKMLPQFAGLIVQLIQELESNGFREFWTENKYPLVNKRINELDDLFTNNMMSEQIEKYKQIPSDEVNVYICSFAHPHGTKVYRDSLIVDHIWSDKIIINTFAHELFHPPYILENVTETIGKLKGMDFIKKAYEEQNPQIAYHPMESFIEENIVEALGTYIASIVGFENEPYKYFEKHDGGSHVVSPYLFKYLSENEISPGQSFKEYFREFVRNIDSIKLP
ncbi:MAG: hypothetical protein R3232_11725 [Clostridia bacterium]|nr:hypothetical protein [Clostridia bacterium]